MTSVAAIDDGNGIGRAVELLIRDGYKVRDVAELLGVHPRAVRAELAQNRPAEAAHNRRSRDRQG